MKLQTPISIPEPPFQIEHSDRIQLFGSCFVQHIGDCLEQNKWEVDNNPMGVIFNPLSMADSLERIASNDPITAEMLFLGDGVYRSFTHHSSFGEPSIDATLRRMNDRIDHSSRFFKQADLLILTWGTAYVYESNQTGRVVANCHKMPERAFRRRLLSVEEIVERWTSLLEGVLFGKRIVLTISPVRHLKDGLHANQVSKSTLFLAAETLLDRFSNLVYFPSYEIMMDELRDYRFYDSDMLHPSPLAVDYIWERFDSLFFSASTRQLLNQWAKLRKAIEHRPFNPDTDAYRHHLQTTYDKLIAFSATYPHCRIDSELQKIQIPESH